jgi:tRNA threonylcarbamoyladenosine biosynthesis protein TsaB
MTTNLLALETSGRSGSIALAKMPDSFETLRESLGPGLQGLSSGSFSLRNLIDPMQVLSLELDPSWGSAKTLAPAIQKLLAQDGLEPKDLHAIGVVQGPGSFTGLRVGIATAKVMAYALRLPVVAIDTLDVIAQQVSDTWTDRGLESVDLFAVADAFRGQSFWAKYRLGAGECVQTIPTRIDDNTWLAKEIAQQNRSGSCSVAGPSLQKLRDCHRDFVTAQSPTALENSKLVWEDRNCGEPRASTVARLAWRAWLRQQTTEPFVLLPKYYRSSAAEEKQTAGLS